LLRRYADGKVCLSLLGTFSSSDASERWNPATSSLFQVLAALPLSYSCILVARLCVLTAQLQLLAETACLLRPQVLLSIQGMILIGDPYFNEPSVEQMRSTAQGAST
jgi:hypothetical protein